MKKVGLIINPIAGMGGSVGLKGTDTPEIVKQAFERGAVPKSEKKARQALETFLDLYKKPLPLFLCYGPSMGLDICRDLHLPHLAFSADVLTTTGEDTQKAARWMQKEGADLLVFAGGDGTARDLLLSGVDLPALGIPTGVKIHSSVFALTPKHAGRIIASFLENPELGLQEREVMDLDEALYRQGNVQSHLFGYMKVPTDPRNFQGKKSGGYVRDEEALEQIAARIIEEMQPDVYYFVGPGSSTQPILKALGIEGSLLGVDILLNKELIKADSQEKDLLEALDRHPAKILVSIIGGQGFIFGRGNHQFSSAVLKRVGKKNVTIIATANKLASLGGAPLHIDLDDPLVEKEFLGFYRIPVDRVTDYVYRCSNEGV